MFWYLGIQDSSRQNHPDVKDDYEKSIKDY